MEQRLWLTDASAKGRYVSSSFTGQLDLEKDLGFKNSKLPQSRILWDINDSHSIRLDYLSGKFMGSADRTERREFLGGLISREIMHHAEEQVDIRFWKVGWIHYSSPRPEDKIRVGFLFDIKTVSLKGTATVTSMMENTSPFITRGQTSWQMTSPTIGVVIQGKPHDRLGYMIECAGLTNGKNGFMFADYEASVHWLMDAKRDTSLVAGYHVIHYKNYRSSEKSQLDEVKFSGAFYGIEKKF